MIFIIDNYDSFSYNLYQILALYYPKVEVRRPNKLSLAEIEDSQPVGVILSPGPGHPEKAKLCLDLVSAMAKGELPSIPLLGVCLGHQAIALALGAKITQAAKIYHGKTDLIFHSQTGLYKNLPSPFKAGRYHSLVAEALPASLIVEAKNSQNTIMGIRHQSLPIMGLQFHPESILTPQGFLLLQAFVDLCRRNHHESS